MPCTVLLETQLSLTNRAARLEVTVSPNMVPFHMIGMVSY